MDTINVRNWINSSSSVNVFASSPLRIIRAESENINAESRNNGEKLSWLESRIHNPEVPGS